MGRQQTLAYQVQEVFCSLESVFNSVFIFIIVSGKLTTLHWKPHIQQYLGSIIGLDFFFCSGLFVCFKTHKVGYTREEVALVRVLGSLGENVQSTLKNSKRANTFLKEMLCFI